MSSEGRYLYHQPPPGMPSSYDYASYHPPSYDSPHVPPPQTHQSSMRSARNSSSQSHSPHSPPTYQPSQASYHPNYNTSSYTIPPPQAPSWPNESWPHYPPSFPSSSVPDVTFNSGPGRPEVASNASEPRPYVPSQPPPDFRRHEERGPPIPAPQQTPPQSTLKGRRRDKDASLASSLDYTKLSAAYRMVMDVGGSLHDHGPARPPLDTIERMLHSAAYGAQALEAALAQPTPAPPVAWEAHSPDARESEEPKGQGASDSSQPKRQKPDDAAPEGQTCLGCSVTSTPEWRRGPLGPRTLCNACGLVYAKLIKKRFKEATRAAGKSNGKAGPSTQPHGEESGMASTPEGGTDDEDSAGSPSRHSEFGDSGQRD